MRRGEPQVDVTVTNIKKLVPACRRCRIRSNEMLADDYQPMLCKKCCEVIRDEYPRMVPLDKPDFQKARECLWEHERECDCWHEGCRFPDES